MNWKDFINLRDDSDNVLETLTDSQIIENYGVYSNSINSNYKCTCFIAKDKTTKFLIVTKGEYLNRFDGETIKIDSGYIKKCPLTVSNSIIIRESFSFTNPVSVSNNKISIGLGDRLGAASAGHLRLIKGKNVFPVLAQQSIRELNLTGRTYEDVLSAAVWAVLQEGYKDGFGADGDHLKTSDEVNMALNCGFTMITLDCSEYINDDPAELLSTRIGSAYSNQKYWEGKYLGKTFSIGTTDISINENELADTVKIYSAAIDFAENIYNNIIKTHNFSVDFEISIDETLTPTNVKAHYIVASEFYDRGVIIRNMAPRFCGEFQKGIDYRGDVDQFREELIVHDVIAKHFGYRLRIHSGSDKFSVFPIIGQVTKGSFHVKTAGTNWLEALRVIAIEDAELFRDMYRHSIKRLDDAKMFYHIFTEKSMVPNDEKYPDNQLVNLLDEEESRQALHITYGYLLGDKDVNDRYLYRDRFFGILHKYESTYYKCLKYHISRHLDMLGIQ